MDERSAEAMGYRLGRKIEGILDSKGRFVPIPEGYFSDVVVPTVTLQVVKIDYEKKEVTLDSKV